MSFAKLANRSPKKKKQRTQEVTVDDSEEVANEALSVPVLPQPTSPRGEDASALQSTIRATVMSALQEVLPQMLRSLPRTSSPSSSPMTPGRRATTNVSDADSTADEDGASAFAKTEARTSFLKEMEKTSVSPACHVNYVCVHCVLHYIYLFFVLVSLMSLHNSRSLSCRFTGSSNTCSISRRRPYSPSALQE